MNSASSIWLLLLLAVLSAVLLILFRSRKKGRRFAPLPPFGRVRFDEEVVIHQRENHEEGRLFWRDLTGLRILTTQDGPFLQDVFRVFESDQEILLKIPSETEGMSNLSDRLMKLTGFQSARMIEAMSSTDTASFEVWQKAHFLRFA